MLKKIATILVLFTALGYSTAQAQYILGASYEVRSEEPTHGFGLHFQNDFNVVPAILDLGFRFQFSFYNESYSTGIDDVSIRREDTAYDFGLGLIATANAGFLAPYAGIGLGYEVFDRSIAETAGISAESGSDGGIYYYGAVGAGLKIIPVVRPYVEYRYSGISSSDFMPSAYGTWAFGLQLRF